MELEQDDILKIMKLIEESPFNQLDLKIGNIELRLSKVRNDHGKCENNFSLQGKDKNLHTMLNSFRTVDTPRREPSTQKNDVQDKENIVSEAQLEEGVIPIKSPILGTFYTSPKPGAPPFVEIGTYVNAEDTVCIIEVMKLFNSIKAGFRGVIKDICVNNGDMVEVEQVLFLVQPE